MQSTLELFQGECEAGLPNTSAGAHPLRSRPCDTCRVRKTRCVKHGDQSQCILCAFHGKQCTYLRGPPPRQQRNGAVRSLRLRETRQLGNPGPLPSEEDGASSPEVIRDHQEIDAPGDGGGPIPLLNGSLGLDLATHPEYVGPTNHREPALLDLYRPNGGTHSEVGLSPERLTRRLNDRTIFVIYPDEATASEPQRLADCDAIEASIQPLGKTLVDLYFRIVHPSFPILHKGVFVTKHAVSHRMFSPPLLAAVYLIALDYQLYDSAMAGGVARPANDNGQAELEKLAERTMADDLKRPKLSTLQAGLLLLQRCRTGVDAANWMFTAQMVSLAQGLGLHVDCQWWAIPEWEKGLRRRLGWALYAQDRWGAFIHGRPPLLSADDWDLQPCSLTDFPETSADEDHEGYGVVQVDTGRELFIRHVELAQMLTEIVRRFYTSAATKPGGTLDRMGVVAAAEMAKPLLLRLREWHAGLPAKLRVESVQPRKLSAAGSLHVAYAAAEVALHRALIRILTPNAPADLAHAVRSGAKSTVQRAVGLLGSLTPEHTGAFWGGATAHQIAVVGSLAGLLWATAETPEEIDWCSKKVDELRWVLRVRGQAAAFMREALRLLEGDVGQVGLIRPSTSSS
ncbi:fungal-specific transcription factor domain-containing protein [Hypoxylon crocopeplum]|nr:fungal-specific transcription factor domain-containing protein [Hypoxylon crocopeplum]